MANAGPSGGNPIGGKTPVPEISALTGLDVGEVDALFPKALPIDVALVRRNIDSLHGVG